MTPEELDAKWLGVMVTYTEQDFPGAEPYQRTIPGWQCRACGQKYGTAGLPPSECSGCVRPGEPSSDPERASEPATRPE